MLNEINYFLGTRLLQPALVAYQGPVGDRPNGLPIYGHDSHKQQTRELEQQIQEDYLQK